MTLIEGLIISHEKRPDFGAFPRPSFVMDLIKKTETGQTPNLEVWSGHEISTLQFWYKKGSPKKRIMKFEWRTNENL